MTARSTPIPVGDLGVDPRGGGLSRGYAHRVGVPLRRLQVGGVISGGLISRGLSPAFVFGAD